MADYVQLGDVHTYYEEDGHGEPLVLLHPGGADSRVFESNLPASPRTSRCSVPIGAGTAVPPTSRVRSPTS